MHHRVTLDALDADDTPLATLRRRNFAFGTAVDVDLDFVFDFDLERPSRRANREATARKNRPILHSEVWQWDAGRARAAAPRSSSISPSPSRPYSYSSSSTLMRSANTHSVGTTKTELVPFIVSDVFSSDPAEMKCGEHERATYQYHRS